MSNVVKINLDNIALLKDKVVMKLVGQDRCEDLEYSPHIKVLDMAVVFYMFFDEKNEASMLITNDYTEKWGVTAEDLYELAKVNTPRILGASIRGIAETLCTMLYGEDSDEMVEAKLYDAFGGIPLYVVSNFRMYNGAAVMMYPNFLKTLHKQLKANYYIIPSSLHEIIIVNSDEAENIDEIKHMITEVNRYELLPENVLTDTLYYFDGELKIA